MRWPAPRSFAGQLTLLLVLAVLAAQVPVSVYFALGSSRVGRVAFTVRIGDRVAALVRILAAVPPDLAAPVVAAYTMPTYHFSIEPDGLVPDGAMDADEAEVALNLARRLGPRAGAVRVQLVDVGGGTLVRYLPWRATPKALRVAIRLATGRWLNVEAWVVLPDAPLWVQIGLLQLAASIVAILAAVGFGLRTVIRPVTALAEAAERGGHGVMIAPLPERGPRELRTMTAAFNAMQERLRAFVDDRMRMLGALSHDLRTPLASLWLRAEMVEEADLREAMVRTLAEMKRMVEATLAFARDDAAAQESGFVDLARLARSLVEDHRTLGRDVAFEGPATAPFDGRSVALRRALDNLVENAVRYGGRARVSLVQGADGVRIWVEDDGPGLPPDRIEEMFQPFVRLDASRNPDTGGTGLGLAIARSAVREHGGDLVLTNLPTSGLRAQISLPRGSAGWPQRARA